MNIQKLVPSDGYIVVRVDRDEDAWYLEDVIEPGDYVKGRTERKIKVGSEGAQKNVRKKMVLGITVESTDFDMDHMSLRIKGKIRDGPEDISLGSYHSFSVSVGDILTIKKQDISPYVIKKLKEAEEPPTNTLLVLVDRDEASVGRVTNTGWEEIMHLQGDAEKKQYKSDVKGSFFEEVAEKIESYSERYDVDSVILASPSFWKENVMSHIPEGLKKKIILVSVSRIDGQGYEEVLQKEEVSQAMQSSRQQSELQHVEAFMKALREEKAAYGLQECIRMAKMGAVENVLVSESFMRKTHGKGGIRFLMKKVEQMDGDVHFVSSATGEKKIDSLGGVVATLRWSP